MFGGQAQGSWFDSMLSHNSKVIDLSVWALVCIGSEERRRIQESPIGGVLSILTKNNACEEIQANKTRLRVLLSVVRWFESTFLV